MLIKMPRPNEDVSPSHGVSTTVSPSFTIPPHVMGRTVHNPTIDSGPGRRLQKPRPGMRVPYRNLTSQIVTQDEIAEEILKRQMKRNSTSQPRVLLVDSVRNRALHFAGSGNATFAKSLSQKLANQLSSQTDGEEKSANGLPGSNGVMWPQVQVESHEQNQFINTHGCYPVKDKLSVEVINCDSNGIDAAVLSQKKASISPRISNQKTPKLDREAEKEIALKQLKELPMIKDSESAVRRKNLIKSDTSLQLSLSMTTQSDVKAYCKVEAKGSSCNEDKVNVNSSDCSSDIGQALLSTQDSGNGKLVNSASKSVHSPIVHGTSNGKGNDSLYKFRAQNKSYPKKNKFQGKKMLKSNLANGHRKKFKKENGLKRRSARLSDKDILSTVKESPQKVPLPPNGMKKRKRGRPSNAKKNANQSKNNCSVSPVSKAEECNSAPGESSPKKARISGGNSNDSSMRGLSVSPFSLVSPLALKVESSSALKSPVDQTVILSQAESKEMKKNTASAPGKKSEPKQRRNKYLTEVEKLIKDEGAASMLMETGTLGGGDDNLIKPVLIVNKRVVKSMELQKLFRDEGVVNMLMGTIPHGQQMIVKRIGKSLPKDLRKVTRQRIIYKTNLARKSVRLSSSLPSRLRPKTLFKRKQEIERKRKLDEKKRQLFTKRESSVNQLEKKLVLDIKKVPEEKKKVGDVEKIERVPELIDISKSPPKRERDYSMPIDMSLQRFSLPLAAKTSRIIRRHSSSSSFSSRSSSPVGMNSKSRRGSSSSNSPKEIPHASRDSKLVEQLTMSLESLPEAQMKGNAGNSRLNCISRCSSSRKVVAVPRMSAAVRLKLNSEMSKNFQKGLNVENAKSISAKVNSSPKAKKSPVQSEQSFKLNSVIDVELQSPNQASSDIKTQLSSGVSEVKLSPSVEIIKGPHPICPSSSHVVPSNSVSSNVLSPPPLKDLDIISGGELAVCVKKLQERKDVSITAINECGERTVEIPSSIPATRPLVTNKSPETCATSVIPHQTASSSGVLVEVVPKIKKFRTPKVPFLKNIMGKEHRIVGLPLSPIASYNSVMKSLENVAQKHKKKANSKMGKLLESKESFRQRSSGRQNAGTYNYKEIFLRRHENFVQLILTPCSTKMKNSLNVQVLHEFRDALQQLRRDECCRVVLVTSTGSSFCQGLDLHSLLHTNIERRKKAALELSEALKEFLRVLAMFNKPIVAGVHGATVGLGVTMLPFFDVVYASDKATFHAPYARLGQIPEGAAVLTLPLMLGNSVTSELLFGSRKLTASEALHYGLVTRVFWPDTFQEELIPNITAMANQSSQSMQAMKALLRLNLRVKLEATLDSESSLLVQHWCSPECQRNFRKFLETSDEVFLQRQKKDPC